MNVRSWIKSLGRITPWALLLVGVIYLMLPVQEGAARHSVVVEHRFTPLTAPRNAIVLRTIATPYTPIQKSQAIYQIFDNEGTVDVALTVNRLEKLVEDILQANGGAQTATVNQLRQKIAFSRAILSRSSRSRPLGSTVPGIFAPVGGLYDGYVPKGTVLARILEPGKFIINLELDEKTKAPSVGSEISIEGIQVDAPVSNMKVNGEELSGASFNIPSAQSTRIDASGNQRQVESGTASYTTSSANAVRAKVASVEHLNQFKERPLTDIELKALKVQMESRLVARKDGTLVRFFPSKATAKLYRWEKDAKPGSLGSRLVLTFESKELHQTALAALRTNRKLKGSVVLGGSVRPRWKRLFD